MFTKLFGFCLSNSCFTRNFGYALPLGEIEKYLQISLNLFNVIIKNMPSTLYETVIDWLQYHLNQLDKNGIILRVRDEKGKEYFTSLDREEYEAEEHTILQHFSRVKELFKRYKILEVYEVHLVIQKDQNSFHIKPIPLKILDGNVNPNENKCTEE